MEDEKDKNTRAKDFIEMEDLLKKSAEMKARHQLTKNKVAELKREADEFLAEHPQAEE